MRKNTKITLGVVSAAVVALVAFMAPIAARVPTPQADRIAGNGIVGIVEGSSIAWIIPTTTGVVLIDAGGTAASENLRAEIGDRTVHKIFLTHGHYDHTAGVRNYPEAEIIVGAGESGLVTGENVAEGWMARMTKPMLGAPDFTPPLMREFSDGEVFEIDGEAISAIHVPGHTSGSAAYLWGDVLFIGDTVVGRDGYVNELPKPLYDSYAQVPSSVAKLNTLNFETIADGHVGLHNNGKALLAEYVAKNN